MYTFIEAVLKEARFKSIKIMHHPSYASAHWNLKNVCFISVALTESGLQVFGYNVVNERSFFFK